MPRARKLELFARMHNCHCGYVLQINLHVFYCFYLHCPMHVPSRILPGALILNLIFWKLDQMKHKKTDTQLDLSVVLTCLNAKSVTWMLYCSVFLLL